MSSNVSENATQTLEVKKEIVIAAPIEIVFETILEQMGPYNEGAPGTGPMPMTLEAWPGGRWFRDFGNNTGHWWGHVQSFKPPTLLEIHGPLFMSSPAISHVQYRLTPEGGATRVKFSHRAIGQIAPEHADGSRVDIGWTSLLSRISSNAEQKTVQQKAKETK
jgi:uncharacterized protein YndB with AHSA1/START domain